MASSKGETYAFTSLGRTVSSRTQRKVLVLGILQFSQSLKTSGKWRLLHDLRAINAVMQPTEALQPGLPSPLAIPQDWPVVVLDLKDCFYKIPFAPQDKEKFAFSVPSINQEAPMKRYQ